MREAIGRGTWIDKVASEVVAREEKLGRTTSLLRVESGLGASGIPHVGSMADAARAYGMKLALEDLGYHSEFIAYSDDMDGLRKVPEGLPDSLKEHLAKPVSRIPDPFDCHPSYGEHMSSMLREALDEVGIKYRHQSGAEAYRSGLLNDQIIKILENAKAIGSRIKEMLGQEKFEGILPYYPICEGCGRIYVAEAYEFVANERKVLYICRGAGVGGERLDGCRHKGEADVTKGEGKLSWKGEFAARWSAQDVRFEAYGKDIADSVRVNDWISQEILGYPPPHHIRYELFLDKTGRKISKSVGNVFTPQVWLRYGVPQSLLLLMYKRIIGTRTLSVEDIPVYMDEYDSLESSYFSDTPPDNPEKARSLKGLYEYVNLLKPPKSPSTHVPYRLLTQLASVAPKGKVNDYVVDRLLAYRAVKSSSPELKRRVDLASRWSIDYGGPEKLRVSLQENERKAIEELKKVVLKETDPKEIQYTVFEIAKRNNIDPPQFFKLLYRILIGSDRGPRLGPYILDIGPDTVVKQLSQ